MDRYVASEYYSEHFIYLYQQYYRRKTREKPWETVAVVGRRSRRFFFFKYN